MTCHASGGTPISGTGEFRNRQLARPAQAMAIRSDFAWPSSNPAFQGAAHSSESAEKRSRENRSRGTAFLGGINSKTDKPLGKRKRLQFAVVSFGHPVLAINKSLPRLI